MNKTKNTKYKAVIFDFDDTLVKTWAIKWAHHKTVAKQFYNIDLTDEVIKKHWGEPFDTLITHLYQNADTVENMRLANLSLEDQFLKEIHDGSLEVVNNLLDQGVIIGILTAGPKSLITPELANLGFPIEKITYIQTADDTVVHKPNPEVFKPMLEKLAEHNIQKADIIYVGDAVTDFYASRDAGLNFIAVTSGIITREEFNHEGATQVIDSINELLYIFN